MNNDKYYKKYLNYKSKYLELVNKQNNLKMIGGNKKKCGIEPTDIVLFGDGGSSAIIIITKNKLVYKVFTLYDFVKSIDIDDDIKIQNRRVKNEIKICELLTKNIINKNICHHFVKYYGTNSCTNAKSLFSNCPKSYVEFLKIADDKKIKLCDKYFKGYPSVKLQNKYQVVEIEYCNYSCENFIKDISNISTIEMEKYLDIFFFQIIYTIMATQMIYPYFTHNDLFIRNILGVKEKDNGNFYTYEFNKKVYFIPQKIFFPKINDFGMTNLDSEHKDVKLYKSQYKDIFSIMFDVYNGGNLGSKSLTELCKDNIEKINFLKLYFDNFFNVKVIDEYVEKSKKHMNWDWDAIIDDDFLKSIEMKNPNDLLNDYFYKIFSKINKNINNFMI